LPAARARRALCGRQNDRYGAPLADIERESMRAFVEVHVG
jgi:hypothetical protein